MRLVEIKKLYIATDEITEETFDTDESMSLEEFEEGELYLTPCELNEITEGYGDVSCRDT